MHALILRLLYNDNAQYQPQRRGPSRRRSKGKLADKVESGSLGGLSITELSKRVFYEVLADDCFGQAAQLAYYFLFALFPFLLFLITLLGYIPIPNLLDHLMDFLARASPAEALALVRDHLHSLVSHQHSGLLSFGIILALWTAASAISAIISGLNRAYGVEESRPWWKVRGLAILLVIGLSLFMIAATVLLMFGPQLGNWLASEVGLGDVFALIWNIMRWPVSIMLLMIGLAILYYFAPDVSQRWRWVTPGSMFAAYQISGSQAASWACASQYVVQDCSTNTQRKARRALRSGTFQRMPAPLMRAAVSCLPALSMAPDPMK